MDAKDIEAKFLSAKKEKKHHITGSVVNFSTVTYTFKDGSTQAYDFLEHPGASVIIPIDKKGNFVMVKQFRHAINSLLLEFPAGRIDPGESPLACAKREMQEEIKMIGDLEPLTNIIPAAGYNNEYLYVYIARNLKKGALASDEHEELQVLTIPVQKALKMVIQGEIKDAKTMIGILLYARLISGQR